MHKTEVLNTLRTLGLVPVLRAEYEAQALALADPIAAGGVPASISSDWIDRIWLEPRRRGGAP